MLAGVLGTKIAALGHWPILGDLAVESGIFAFLLLVVMASAVAELYGKETANRLVRFGDKVLVRTVSQHQGWGIRRLGFGVQDTDIAGSAIEALETRALWSRFGL